jgi:ferredoxin
MKNALLELKVINLPEKNVVNIVIHEENCAGCQICQLFCSFTFQRIFAPNKAYIQIDTHEIIPKISFLEGCTQCHQCVKHCLYGALELREGDE